MATEVLRFANESSIWVFEVEDLLSLLSDLGGELEAGGRLVNFERFRPPSERACR